MEGSMYRRQLISGLGTGMFIGPGTASAQGSANRLRRVGLMVAVAENDPEGIQRVEVFRRSLDEAGWVEGRDVTIDVSWYGGNFATAQALAGKHVERGVDVLVVNGTPGMDAVRAVGVSAPVVFVVVTDPVSAGYVPSLSRPGGNITGFSTFEPEIAGKWLQLLAQIAPGLKHVGMLLDPKFTTFNALWNTVRELAPSQGIEPHPTFASTLAEIEKVVETMSRLDSPGLIVSPSPVNTVNRLRLISLANENRVPVIYPFRFYVRNGALLAYGFNAADQFRRAAVYVSRILRGEKAGDLPVQAPALFELGINLRTARAMGLTVPRSLMIAADEIIE